MNEHSLRINFSAFLIFGVWVIAETFAFVGADVLDNSSYEGSGLLRLAAWAGIVVAAAGVIRYLAEFRSDEQLRQAADRAERERRWAEDD